MKSLAQAHSAGNEEAGGSQVFNSRVTSLSFMLAPHENRRLCSQSHHGAWVCQVIYEAAAWGQALCLTAPA
jgi:hypothetical protein